MAILKTFSISTDISSQDINTDKLEIEINSSSFIDSFSGMTRIGDVLNIHGTSISNETSLDSLILNHVKDEDVRKKSFLCDECATVFDTNKDVNDHLVANPTHKVKNIFRKKDS